MIRLTRLAVPRVGYFCPHGFGHACDGFRPPMPADYDKDTADDQQDRKEEFRHKEVWSENGLMK